MSYKRNAYLDIVQLARGTYTNFGEPNTHYSCVTNGNNMAITIKAVNQFNNGDKLYFTVENGNVAFQTFTCTGSSDIVDISGGSTKNPYYAPTVQTPVKLFKTRGIWNYESGSNT